MTWKLLHSSTYRVFEGVIGIDGVIEMARAEASPPCSNWPE